MKRSAVVLPVVAMSVLACALLSVGCGTEGGSDEPSQPSNVTNNLSWDEDWQANGEPPPIEVLSGVPQVGHPMTVRVRFRAEEDAGPVELAIRVLHAEKVDEQGGDPAELGQLVLGEFLLDDPPPGPGENVYDLELIVPPRLNVTAGGDFNLVGVLDPRDLIPETSETPDNPDDPAGDNVLTLEDTATLFSREYSEAPRLVLEELALEPDVLVFNVNELPTVDFDRSRGVATFFGEDLNGDDTRLGRMPGANAARAAFMATLVDPCIEDFEDGFTAGERPTTLAFDPLGSSGAPVSADIDTWGTIEQVPRSATLTGSYPISGEHLMMPPAGTVPGIRLATAQHAVGFYLTDFGSDAESRLGIWLGRQNAGGGWRSIYGQYVALPDVDLTRRHGSVFFFGIVSAEPFDYVELLLDGGPSGDTGGLDDIIIATDFEYDPFGSCAPETDGRIAANVAISATGTREIDDLLIEVDLDARERPDLTDSLRARGQLPLQFLLSEGTSTLLGFKLAPGQIPLQGPGDGSAPDTNHLPRTIKDFHVELCPPSELLAAAAGLLGPGAGSLDLAVDVTTRILTPASEEYLGVEDNELTDTVLLRFVDPPPPPSKEWNFDKKFGGSAVGGAIALAAGVYADPTGTTACASGEFDATLFGYRLDNIVDTCARAFVDLESEPSKAGFGLQVRNLTLGIEGGRLVTRHHVLYERRSEVEFVENEEPRLNTDLEFEVRDGSEQTSPIQYEKDVGKWKFEVPGSHGMLLSYTRSWKKCKSTVVIVVPVGFEIEIGGTVGVRTQFEAIRHDDGQHELSLMAGPAIQFFGAGSVFLGACAGDLPKSTDDLPASSAVDDLLECGKVAGASVNLVFLDFLIGPRTWAKIWREARESADGYGFEMGVSLEAQLKILQGAISLWVHYLAPKICWVRILGHRVFPYICGIGCNRAGVTIASFPGFKWTLFSVELAKIEDWMAAATAGCDNCCPGCPREN